MKPHKKKILAINKSNVPWSCSNEWQQAKTTLLFLKNNYEPKLARAKDLACALDDDYKAGYETLDAACNVTCSHCPLVCCVNAHVWADFTDLVFWTLKEIAFPPHQLLNLPEKGCCYLGQKGCSLSRSQRPWICTWYICPTQTRVLIKNRQWESWQNTVFKIKQGRKKMLAEFVRIVS